MHKHFVMEYMYRDADNYKSSGMILLSGEITKEYISEFKSLLDCGEYFVAEQSGIPILYEQLWVYSNGPTSADHAFHEIVQFRPATHSDINETSIWGTATDLLRTFKKINNRWNCSLSVRGEII